MRQKKAEEGNVKLSRFGVVATVGIAFFVAEFRDKTQLATMSLLFNTKIWSAFLSAQPWR